MSTVMQTVMVNASSAYPVHIGAGLLDKTGELIAGVTKSRRCVLVTDSTVGPLYGGRVQASLEKAGFAVLNCAFPAGEQSKNLTTYGEMLEFFAQNRLTRSDFIVALGGGVTGDMAGFAAATYQRGIGYIQVPTSFLAAADSSVGGKTAVNLQSGKNLVGAFHQPKLVICDTDTFETLTGDAFADGMAETLKHGLIADADFFEALTDGTSPPAAIMVRKNVEIKSAVVREDEFEHGARKLLNFGHTLGHAIEKISGFSITHGHAVATGMVLATRAAEQLGYSPAGTLDRVIAANKQYGLPTECPYTAEQIYAAATADKKRDGGSIDVVVLERIGQARTIRLDMEGLRAFVECAI